MAAKSYGRPKSSFTVGQMFGLGKGLGLSSEETKEMAYSLIGKDSITLFTQPEINDVCYELIIRKDKASKRSSRASSQQLHKIAEYECLLGWQDDPQRLQGFLSKYYKVLSPKWLSPSQASKAIEGLKRICSKGQTKEGNNAKST